MNETAVTSRYMRRPQGITPARFAIYAILGLWSFICLFPLYWLAVTSVKSEYAVAEGPFYIPFVDFMPSLEAWKFILFDTHENLLASYLNSVVISFASTFLVMVAGGMAVYGLTRFRHAVRVTAAAAGLLALCLLTCAFAAPGLALKLLLALLAIAAVIAAIVAGPRGATIGSSGIMFALLATRILPPAAIALPIYLMAMATDTLDTHAALIVAYTAVNLPVALWLLQPVIGLRATEQEEAAQLDGASHLTIFFTIVVPMVGGGILATGFLIFVLAWNEYLFAAYLATNHAMTLPTYLMSQISMKEAQVGGGGQELANFSAATVVIALPLVALAGVAQRVLANHKLWKT